MRSAVFGEAIVASTMSSATWMPSVRSSWAAAWVSALVAAAPAAQSPRPGIALRADPPVTWMRVPPPPARSAAAPTDRNVNAWRETAPVQAS